jgi:hypothetical protein
MKFVMFMVLGMLGASLRANANTIHVDAWTNDGYATARCPGGYTRVSCDFENPDSCDSTSAGYDYCRADSHHNRECHITAYCRSTPQHVKIHGWTDHGYVEARCPAGFRRESCSFDYDRCDNTHQGYASCGADSHHNKECEFSGICVEE